jgi:hypothetical protein
MRSKRLVAALLAVMMTAIVMVSGAVAAPAKFTHATGSVWLSSPSQYVEFNAFDYGATGDRGTIHYTNFEAVSPGSGAWLPVAGTYTLTTALGGTPYAHSMTIDTVSVETPTRVLFSGSGYYIADPAYTWTVSGSIIEGVVAFHILYTGTLAGYTFDAIGSAATMSGTGTDSLGQAPLTWTLPATFAHEVLSYTASLTSATVGTTAASFVYTIPAGNPYSGIVVTMAMTDGGSPGAGHDTFSIFGSPYVIIGGNLVVH